MEINPFDYVKAISETKQDFLPEELNAHYVPFLSNRHFSYFPDSVFYANDMNMFPNLPKNLQFDYLKHSLRKKKRFSKWVKNGEMEDINTVREMYECNLDVAKVLMKNIPKEDIEKFKKEKRNDD